MKRLSLTHTHRPTAGAALLALLLASSLLSSCDSFLTDDPSTQIYQQEGYNSMEKLKNNALLTVYNYIGGNTASEGLQGTERGLYDMNSLTTDEQIVPTRGGDWYDGGLWKRLFFHQWNAGEGMFKDTWDYLYKVVVICNEGIEHIEAFQTQDPYKQAQLNAYKAELKAVRAMYYFYLMDLYGRVPLVTDTNTKTNELTLCERRDLFYWIYQELNDALPILPLEESQYPKNEYYGRVTAFVTYFVMMKMAINAEIYTDNDWTDGVYPDGKDIMLKTKNWATEEYNTLNAWETVRYIYDYLETYYDLMENYADNFQVANEFSKENIFVIPMDPQLYDNEYRYFMRSRHYCHGSALGGSGQNGPCATVSTVLAYNYSEKAGVNSDARFTYNFYAGQVFVHDDQEVYEDDGKTPLAYYPLAVTEFDLSGTVYEKTAGARIAKYSADENAWMGGNKSNNDIVLSRFADAVLMYAEACYRLGDKTAALAAMNEVYLRSNLAKGYEQIDEDILLQERLKELMWEGWRRNDLVRFRRYHKPYDLKTDSDFEADAHTTVFPIPADMMTMHPDWKQNPGY